jgi:hypothetical protein
VSKTLKDEKYHSSLFTEYFVVRVGIVIVSVSMPCTSEWKIKSDSVESFLFTTNM